MNCPYCKRDLREFIVNNGPPGEFTNVDGIVIPSDEEIDEAEAAGRASQYISLEEMGINRVNFNLCGEVCCAACAGIGVIDMLKIWMGKYPARAKSILSFDRGTGATDLAQILGTAGIESESRQWEFDTVNRITPVHLAELSPAIVGVGITRDGTVVNKSSTRHWVVSLQVAPSTEGDLCKIYNPFHNRIEIVSFWDIVDEYGRLSSVLKLNVDWEYSRLVMPDNSLASLRQRIGELEKIASMASDFAAKLAEVWP